MAALPGAASAGWQQRCAWPAARSCPNTRARPPPRPPGRTATPRSAASPRRPRPTPTERLPAHADRAIRAEARLELARRAQRTLDVQYYQIENDATGRYLLRALRDAAAARRARAPADGRSLHRRRGRAAARRWPPRPTSSCGCSTPSRPAAAACCGALPPRCSTSAASTGACTTSCSSPTARWRWPAGATSATSTSRRPPARTSSTSTPSSPAPCLPRLGALFDQYWNSELRAPDRGGRRDRRAARRAACAASRRPPAPRPRRRRARRRRTTCSATARSRRTSRPASSA